MKSIFLVLLVLLVSCQREIRNEVGVGYNKELIIPPTNDLPLPNSADENTANSEISKNPKSRFYVNKPISAQEENCEKRRQARRLRIARTNYLQRG